MNGRSENPLTPDSLAADGMQGASAEADSPCASEDNVQAMAAHYLARVAVAAAQAELDRYAAATDHPALGFVEARDLLDVVESYLAATALFDAPKKGTANGGDA